MNRREFLKTTAMGLPALGMTPTLLRAAESKHAGTPVRPNILLLVTDQQRWSALSCAGNRWVQTPYLDELAAGGVRVDRSYCTFPVCSPSRSSLFTGRMPHETGVIWNNMSIQAGIPTFGEMLRGAGYDTHYFGKWHVPHVFPETADEIPGFTSHLLPPGLPPVLAAHGDATDMLVTGMAAEWLKKQKQPATQPWCAVVSIHNPHDICYFYELAHKPYPNVETFPPLPANAAVDPDEPDVVQQWRTTRKGGQFDEATWRAYLQVYYQMTQSADRALGVTLNALQASGQADNTLVLFTSDHGEGAGSHQWPMKLSLYEEEVAVPLLARLPGRITAGRVDTKTLTSGLDIVPTILDYAGVPAPSELRGRSLRPVLDGAGTINREFVVSELGYEKKPGMTGRMVVSARYKYNVFGSGTRREQLFDRQNDPGEMKNLAGDASHRTALDQHRAWLRTWIQETKDDFQQPKQNQQ